MVILNWISGQKSSKKSESVESVLTVTYAVSNMTSLVSHAKQIGITKKVHKEFLQKNLFFGLLMTSSDSPAAGLRGETESNNVGRSDLTSRNQIFWKKSKFPPNFRIFPNI